jgi:hypothetical protein
VSLFNSYWLSILLGFAACMLGLAVLVQILQEFYKLLTSSKSRAYTRALIDFLGPWAAQTLRASFSLTARGPFQLRRLRPKGVILPMEKDQLVACLEKTAPAWVRRGLDLLRQEASLQAKSPLPPPASSSWEEFLNDLGRAEKGTTEYTAGLEIAEWLSEWNHDWKKPKAGALTLGSIKASAPFAAAALLASFQARFLPHVQDAAARYGQFTKNFEYTYGRRNLRQTFIISLLLALAVNLPVGRIYRKARSLSPQDAAALAEKYVNLYDEISAKAESEPAQPQDEDLLTTLGALKQQALASLEPIASQGAGSPLRILVRWEEDIAPRSTYSALALLGYLAECLITAFLICFGAPVWNDIVTLLFRLQKGRSKSNRTEQAAATTAQNA